MNIIDLKDLSGIRYPAGRITYHLIGGSSKIPSKNFAMGYVVLDPNGGQIPWHCHEPEEAYFIISGIGELCIGTEKRMIYSNQFGYIQSGQFHQLTNIGDSPLVMLYCCGQGIVLHGRQELEGTLPIAGKDVPKLPKGARSQKA